VNLCGLAWTGLAKLTYVKSLSSGHCNTIQQAIQHKTGPAAGFPWWY